MSRTQADGDVRAIQAARLRRHHQAVIQAEVRQLLRAIAPHGVLRRDALSRMTHAERWSEGGLDGALRAAVEEGALEPLPLGYYRDRTRAAPAGSAPREGNWSERARSEPDGATRSKSSAGEPPA